MKKLRSILVVTLLLGSVAVAHGNLAHVLGTVVQITDHSLSVKATDGSIKVVEFDAETHFLKGGSPATAKDVLIGSRVVIHAHQNGDKFHAAEVKIGTGTAAANQSTPAPTESK
jgi:NAD/NADP transhydrogenase alpha subunit